MIRSYACATAFVFLALGSRHAHATAHIKVPGNQCVSMYNHPDWGYREQSGSLWNYNQTNADPEFSCPVPRVLMSYSHLEYTTMITVGIDDRSPTLSASCRPWVTYGQTIYMGPPKSTAAGLEVTDLSWSYQAYQLFGGETSVWCKLPRRSGSEQGSGILGVTHQWAE